MLHNLYNNNYGSFLRAWIYQVLWFLSYDLVQREHGPRWPIFCLLTHKLRLVSVWWTRPRMNNSVKLGYRCVLVSSNTIWCLSLLWLSSNQQNQFAVVVTWLFNYMSEAMKIYMLYWPLGPLMILGKIGRPAPSDEDADLLDHICFHSWSIDSDNHKDRVPLSLP